MMLYLALYTEFIVREEHDDATRNLLKHRLQLFLYCCFVTNEGQTTRVVNQITTDHRTLY